MYYALFFLNVTFQQTFLSSFYLLQRIFTAKKQQQKNPHNIRRLEFRLY